MITNDKIHKTPENIQQNIINAFDVQLILLYLTKSHVIAANKRSMNY